MTGRQGSDPESWAVKYVHYGCHLTPTEGHGITLGLMGQVLISVWGRHSCSSGEEGPSERSEGQGDKNEGRKGHYVFL